MNTEIAEALRRAFDDSFREPRAPATAKGEDFLAVTIGGDAFAIRRSEVAGLHADQTIVPIPSSKPALLGLARFRSAIAPVFDLGLLLGYPRAPASRWLVLARIPELVGLAFERFEAHIVCELVDGTVTREGVVRPLVRIQEITERLRREG